MIMKTALDPGNHNAIRMPRAV